jgi:hypothetical protein
MSRFANSMNEYVNSTNGLRNSMNEYVNSTNGLRNSMNGFEDLRTSF